MDCATVGGGLAQVGNKAQRWEGLKCEDTMSSYYFTNFQFASASVQRGFILPTGFSL